MTPKVHGMTPRGARDDPPEVHGMTPEVHGVSYEGAFYLGSFLTSNHQVLEVITLSG